MPLYNKGCFTKICLCAVKARQQMSNKRAIQGYEKYIPVIVNPLIINHLYG